MSYIQPLDILPIREIDAANASGVTSTPFPVNVGGSVTLWVEGQTGVVDGNFSLRGEFARLRTTASDTVVLETARTSDYAGNWHVEATLVAPGGGAFSVYRQRFLSNGL